MPEIQMVRPCGDGGDKEAQRLRMVNTIPTRFAQASIEGEQDEAPPVIERRRPPSVMKREVLSAIRLQPLPVCILGP